ncbi:MAG: permease [Deltaproteobacteria bacterium]|nr:permease [Deltaproteobacteria bacterium]
MLEMMQGVAYEAFDLLARMAPYLILGIVVAGALHVILPTGTVARLLGRPGLGSVVKASAVGVPLPLCSCGVVPVAASLKKSGASGGSVVSFLVSTPTTGVDSFLATYSLIGLPIAVIRVVASFVLGIVAGAATVLGLRSAPATPEADSASAAEPSQKGSRVVRGLAYGFDELMGGIARPLLVGLLLGGAVAYFLPAGVLQEYVGQGFVSYLVMMAVGIPLYVCASGSIPLAAALMAKGISPGAALVFLIAGPATNMATMSVVSKMIGGRALAIYLVVIAAGSLGVGAATDAFFGAFPALVPALSVAHGHEHSGLNLFEILSGGVLAALTLFHVVRPMVGWLRAKLRSPDDRYVVAVPDMSCQHCARTITGAVSELPGVRSVDADPSSKTVVFELTETADTQQLLQAISDAGFKPVEDQG